MLVGVDLGGSKALGVLWAPETGEVLARQQVPADGEAEGLVETIVGLVGSLIEGRDEVPAAVGLGVAGLAHRSGVVRYSPNVPGLVEYPIADAVGSRLGVPVTLVNDASAGALAEARLGAGRGVDDFVYVALGTGIGVGLVVGGRLVTGAHGFAGEAGHITVDRHGPEHLTGRRGPWEYYASGSALGRLAREEAAAGRFPAGIELAGSADALLGDHLTRALADGDHDAARILDGFCREVAAGAADLVLLLDPRRLVLGGGLTGIGEPLRAGVDRWLAEELLGQAHRPRVEVRLAETGPEANAVGAAFWAADRLA